MPDISINAHSSIRIQGTKTVLFDPFGLWEESHDADIICITHDHYDHFSPEDIAKASKDETVIVLPFSCVQQAIRKGFRREQLIPVECRSSYTVKGVEIRTVPAYNKAKAFHPEKNGWVGYVITMDSETVYVAGDTDALEENTAIRCDTALVPVGGTYTMDPQEAAAFINALRPKTAIPTHYGSIVGSAADGEVFCGLVDPSLRTERKL